MNDKIDIDEAIRIVGRKKRTIQYWIADGLIINYSPGSQGKRMRFDKVELEAAANAQGNPDELALLRNAITAKVERLKADGFLKSPHELIAA